jgi:hypothetical protein
VIPDSPDALGLNTINGLPAHILLVHAVVVFVPLAAIALVASLRPVTARRLGLLVPGVALLALASVVLAMNAGGWLQDHVHNTALVRRHTDLGGQLWPFSFGVLVLSLVTWWIARRTDASETTAASREHGGAVATIAVGVLAVAVSVASIVQVVRIGESGSRAAWNNHFSTTSLHGR